VAQGAQLLFAYAIGIGIPFVLAAAFAGPFLQFVRQGGPWMHRMEIVIGVVLLLTGLLFLSERGMAWISTWMLEAAPGLWEGLL
jgi:cytochrome c-type biogenesis protein